MSAKDSVTKTIAVAGGLCIICSILVSFAAVSLKPIQDLNRILDKKKNILLAAAIYKEGDDIEAVFKEKVVARVLDVAAAAFSEEIKAEDYDEAKAMKDASMVFEIPAEQDIARIRKRGKYAVVYMVRGDSGSVEQIVLPVVGKGLWSTMYGFMALKPDVNTVSGLGFYQHGETPGLGGEVDNPRWKALWVGKKLHDEDWKLKITVVKGAVDPKRPEAVHQVDGLSGATITSRGVDLLVQYWMGENAFGPFLDKIKNGEVTL